MTRPSGRRTCSISTVRNGGWCKTVSRLRISQVSSGIEDYTKRAFVSGRFRHLTIDFYQQASGLTRPLRRPFQSQGIATNALSPIRSLDSKEESLLILL